MNKASHCFAKNILSAGSRTLLALGVGIILGIQTLGALPAMAAADKYDIDAVHTFVLFKVNHLGFSNSYGRFREVSGQILIDEDKAENSSVNVTIKAASLNTDDAKRDEHLRGADFFNVKQFPEVKFTSKSVKKAAGNLYKIEGELELMGIKKNVSFDFKRQRTGKDPWGSTRTGGDFSFKIKRSDFKMEYMKEGIGDEIEIIASVEGIKK